MELFQGVPKDTPLRPGAGDNKRTMTQVLALDASNAASPGPRASSIRLFARVVKKGHSTTNGQPKNTKGENDDDKTEYRIVLSNLQIFKGAAALDGLGIYRPETKELSIQARLRLIDDGTPSVAVVDFTRKPVGNAIQPGTLKMRGIRPHRQAESRPRGCAQLLAAGPAVKIEDRVYDRGFRLHGSFLILEKPFSVSLGFEDKRKGFVLKGAYKEPLDLGIVKFTDFKDDKNPSNNKEEDRKFQGRRGHWSFQGWKLRRKASWDPSNGKGAGPLPADMDDVALDIDEAIQRGSETDGSCEKLVDFVIGKPVKMQFEFELGLPGMKQQDMIDRKQNTVDLAYEPAFVGILRYLWNEVLGEENLEELGKKLLQPDTLGELVGVLALEKLGPRLIKRLVCRKPTGNGAEKLKDEANKRHKDDTKEKARTT
ncbi:hypothetical protein B0T25DRAFT_572405 [Lasiosphaeria hispida]|uniref:Uncharacterized protein n=1 Tax=Lasiosphaeria hispida TaxID=260671 RepID=A0AAJ0H7Y8_9PEZI|nr:hypothetical protein B0T25DRAFT_572405 [Lasiosphaeria hispida]